MLVVQNVRLTNRGEQPVSLGVALVLDAKEGDPIYLREGLPDLSFMNVKDHRLNWLRCPIDVAPASSVGGVLGFILIPEVEQLIDLEKLEQARETTEPPFPLNPHLEVKDWVTAKKIRFSLPGGYPSTNAEAARGREEPRT